MTIKEIKNLTKFLTDEELDKIKEEIKSKETILKKQDVEEGEMGQVLNTLFAILVIEKTLENEIEGVEEIRAELEQELLEAYEIYDNHMAKYKKEEKKKKKKNWLLDFLFMSEEMQNRKDAIGASKKEVAALQKELGRLKQLKSDQNLRNVMRDRHGPIFEEFCNCWKECDHPHHNHGHDCEYFHDRRGDQRLDRVLSDVQVGRTSLRGNLTLLPREENSALMQNIMSSNIGQVYNNYLSRASDRTNIESTRTDNMDRIRSDFKNEIERMQSNSKKIEKINQKIIGRGSK